MKVIVAEANCAMVPHVSIFVHFLCVYCELWYSVLFGETKILQNHFYWETVYILIVGISMVFYTCNLLKHIKNETQQ